MPRVSLAGVAMDHLRFFWFSLKDCTNVAKKSVYDINLTHFSKNFFLRSYELNHPFSHLKFKSQPFKSKLNQSERLRVFSFTFSRMTVQTMLFMQMVPSVVNSRFLLSRGMVDFVSCF